MPNIRVRAGRLACRRRHGRGFSVLFATEWARHCHQKRHRPRSGRSLILPSPRSRRWHCLRARMRSCRPPTNESHAIPRRREPHPQQLTLDAVRPLRSDEAAILTVSAKNAGLKAAVVIGGLAAGSALSAGTRLGGVAAEVDVASRGARSSCELRRFPHINNQTRLSVHPTSQSPSSQKSVRDSRVFDHLLRRA
jgi:hypothetical protein